ncbi:MAG: hypothetical protein SH818_11820 [Saprospiraceae bacterium]|nr:hypothetical protein [Saprospiraceae bacterium]
MYKFFLGVDVSKGWIDVSSTEGLSVNYASRFNNSIAGFTGISTITLIC